MQRGVHPHTPMAQGPIETSRDLASDFRRYLSYVWNVDDGGLVGIVDGSGDRDLATVGRNQDASIARLSSGLRIEDGAIEDDAAALVDDEYARRCLA
jgi:hypothetical protein